MTDEMRERLARLDPMHSGVPTEPTTSESSRELLEQIMSTPIEEKTDRPAAPRRTWTVAVAAVAVLIVAVAGGIALSGRDENPPVAAAPPVKLSAGVEDTMSICIAFSPEELERGTQLAFAGTVTAVNGPAVTLTVDTWYRGGDAAEAVLNAPEDMEALIGGIPFEVGSQYLISAVDGNVNYCGFSGPATPELTAAYEEAFAQG